MNKKRTKPKPEWKIRREIEILENVSKILTIIFFTLAAFATGCIITWEMVYGQNGPRAGAIEEINSAEFGLYAGFTEAIQNAETMTEPVEVEESEKEIAKESASEEEAGEAFANRWSPEDYETMAHLIYAEGGGQGETCMLYIGSVLLNRVESDRFPDTLKECINQPGQYSVKNWYMDREPSEEAYFVAEYLLTVGSELPDFVLYQHYRRPVAGTTTYAEINGEVFSY